MRGVHGRGSCPVGVVAWFAAPIFLSKKRRLLTSCRSASFRRSPSTFLKTALVFWRKTPIGPLISWVCCWVVASAPCSRQLSGSTG